MAEYSVAVPILGTALVMVEADSEKEAIRLAVLDALPEHVDVWEAYEVISEGNFYHGQINRARIDSVDHGDEEEDDNG